MSDTIFSVIDDSGLIGIIDPVAYAGFVGEFWGWSELMGTFQSQMSEQRLLLWGTDQENDWRVRVVFEPVAVKGFREAVGSIRASDGLLLLTSFDSLIGAAGDKDTDLPEPYHRHLLSWVESGTYQCRIIQLYDHAYNAEDSELIDEAETHYILELLRSDTIIAPWKDIPWKPFQ